MSRTLPTALWACLLGSAVAGEPVMSPSTASAGVPAEVNLPDLDVLGGSFTFADGMDFDDIDGSLSVTEFELLSILSKPITVPGDITLVPALQYSYTGLDFDDTAPAFPVDDEGLHSLSLHLAALKMNQGSPWFYGAWARAELASDFQHINGDDFTFDIAAGVGHRCTDSFTVAAGFAVINLNGDEQFFPGINFDWVVNEKMRVGLYGPMALVSYTPNADWSFSLRGTPGGGVWNITDNGGDSKSVDLSSYRVGLFASRRLTDYLWLNAGAGVTLFNNLTYADPDGGNELLDEDMDSGWFAQIGLSLRVW